MLVGEIEQRTNIRLEDTDYFGTFINAIGVDYDSEDVISTRRLYILNTLEINRATISQNGRVTNFEQDFVEYIGNKSYIPTSGNCFKKGINHLTGKDYSKHFLTPFRT